jgi:uncharacterized membrane protein (DUF106 family)
MSNIAVVIQIMFITLGMIIFGMVLNYFLGLKKDTLKEMRDNALNLRERMKNAQLIGDYQSMAQLQRESVAFMKLMMKKQLIPMCLRCMIFIGLFIVLGFIYSNYQSGLLPFPLLIFGSGWLAIYVLFSLFFSLFIFGTKKLISMGSDKKSPQREIMEIISPTRQSSGSSISIYETAQNQRNESEVLSKEDSWKNRIEE